MHRAMCQPICASCKVPADMVTLDSQSIFVLKMTVRCHGKEEYVEVPVEQALRQPWILVFKRTAFNRVNMRP